MSFSLPLLRGFFTLASLLSFLPALAQRLTGEIRDAVSGAPIPYASVGVVGQGLGTVADEKGHFSFDPGSAAANASVRISCIGFTTAQLTLAELRQRSIVLLKGQPHDLPEATVRPKKLKREILGRDKSGGMADIKFGLKDIEELTDQVGREAGTLIKVPGDCYLETLRFYLERNDFRQMKLRLNFYTIKDDLPDQLLNEQDIRFAVENQQTGWITFDLTPYHLRFDQKEIAATFQWLSAEPAPDRPEPIFQMPAGFPVVGHQIFFRQKSQSAWENFPANLSIGFTAECGKREK